MRLKRYYMTGRENRYALTNLSVPYCYFDLDESIDEAVMYEALKEAIKYHPLFGTRIGYDGTLFYFEENPLPPILFREDNAPEIYGNADTNYYPWIVVINDRRFLIYNVHSICDGTGIYDFAKTILHLYFERRGMKFTDTTTDFPKGTPEQTMENSIEKYADEEYDAIGIPRFAPPAKVEAKYLQMGRNEPWRLIIPKQAIKKFTKESETSVFAVISAILARAMAKAYDINEGNIAVRVPVSYRAAFPSYTDRNFAQGFSLCYKAERMNAMPYANIETAFRSQLDIWMDKGNLLKTLKMDMEQLERLKADPDEKNKIMNFRRPPDPSAIILYSHITQLGFSDELLSRITDISMAAHIILEDYVSVYGLSLKSDISLTIHQCSKDDCYIDALRETLEERGVPFTLETMKMAADRNCAKLSDLINS